jgi:hypothetical protein
VAERLLASMLERAERLGSSGDPLGAVKACVERGLLLLETGAVGLDSPIDDHARFDLLRIEALELIERNAALEAEVYALADESEALQDRIWELRAQLDPSTERPEPPLRIGLGGPGKQQPEGGAALLEGERLVELEVSLPADHEARLAAAVDGVESWAARRDQPTRVAVALGLVALEQERAGAPGKLDPLRHLAPLSRRTLELRESVKVLELRRNALRIDNRGMRLRIERLERELDSAPEPEQRGEPKGGLLRRLLGRG